MDPIAQLTGDRASARSNRDPCANLCTVATVDENNHPQARTLVLRDLGARMALFLNETSPKWRQISASGVVSVVVWLPSLELQYRLQCHVEQVPKALVDESWLMRPDVPKQLDWYYTTRQPQSSPVASREGLLADLASLVDPVHRNAPATASGWYLQPFHVDRLDLNHPSGVHERRAFSLQGNHWQEAVLVP